MSSSDSSNSRSTTIAQGKNQFPTHKKMNLEQFICWAMATVCGGGGIYGYIHKKSLPSLVAGLGFGTLYGVSANLLGGGRALDGVDLSILASTLLLIAMAPRAYKTRAPMPIALSTASGLILARMGYLSYGLRHARIVP